MKTKATSVGEFEQLVLLAILQLKTSAHAPAIARLLEQAAGRNVSRGALYSSLERLERKGLVTWRIEASGPERRGQPKRLFSVTDPGLDALRAYRQALLRLWKGLGRMLEPSP